MSSPVAENLSRVRERMAKAASRAGRDAGEIRLCVVTKGRGLERVREAAAAGAKILGENRVQEAGPKIEAARDLPAGISWHLIGHLQRNKARRAVQLFDVIQSVDSSDLARKLADLGTERGRAVDAFVEVRTTDEPTKTGMPLERAEEEIAGMRELPGLSVAGLMTMAPLTEDERRIRSSFAALRELRDRLGGSVRELSMGMSADFEIAVEEGATIVRVGSAIFE
ncbi:MAG: YggS family pyridoxal phosphate-dependent enzyme [bacterium]